ncbi:BamA/TamA family outer membrane protein [Chryseolinea sp. T2]|uniref:translocation and assembly module lipoprotein TamL n=1 Tax=Chryseolinea sp. T2 TaxID=3129255 RepID=UPI003077BBF0
MILSGCLGTRHLKDGEKLLYSQAIDAPRHINEDEMRGLYTQHANRRILGLPLAPLVSIYYMGYRKYDQEKFIRKREAFEKKYDQKIAEATSQKKIDRYLFRKQKKVTKMNSFIENGNLFMQWGEPLSIYDSAQVRLTRERFQSYLFSKGYFKNQVVDRTFDKSRFVRVRYVVTPGKAYFIDSLFYDVEDTAIFRIINNNVDKSYLKKGARYDQDNFTKERERIDLLLKDHGYFDFSRQYIDYTMDTTFRSPDRRVAVIISIRDPAKRGYHKKFQIDTVTFTTDVGKTIPGVARHSRTYRDVHYKYYDDNFKLKILNQRVFIRPEELYSRTRTLDTQRQLSNVDAFKFVNINYDTSDGKFIANIFASPASRYEWTNEAGVNVTQGFPGPFYGISFKKRNIFKGMETFDMSGRFGFEGVASATETQNIYKSTAATLNASLSFPQFIWFFKERRRIKFAEYNPKTRLTTGYTFNDRPEYRRTYVSTNAAYTWQTKNRTSYSLTPLSVVVISTANLSKEFQKLLKTQDSLGNNALINSFRPSFVNSIMFGITWNLHDYGNNEFTSSFIRMQFESGGTLWNFFTPNFLTDWGLQHYQYLRLGLDVRRVNPVDKNTVIAYRFNSGVVYSYGDEKGVPYEKFFFAGGSNSIRAWRPRRLGPGSLPPNESTNPKGDGLFDYSIEKPSEILLEGSVELRQKLFGFVNGAVFVDAGNVWNFNPQNVQAEDGSVIKDNSSQFSLKRFYKEFGVGTGFGLRFDFSFLILRFDVGMKVYDPARESGDRFVLNKVRFWKPYATEVSEGVFVNYKEPVIYNVGINYPF